MRLLSRRRNALSTTRRRVGEGLRGTDAAALLTFFLPLSSWKALAEGLVNLYLYHHPANKSYRVIGMNAQQQVVINSSLFPECRYSHSNNVFHTWTDTQFAYGIHFAAEDLAKKFSADFASCVAALNKGEGGPAASAAPPPPPESPSAPVAPGSAAAGMSLAEQMAAKKLKKAEDRPAEEERAAPPPSSGGGGGGGGNMMSELANALTRRSGTGTLKSAAKAKAPAAPAPESPRDSPAPPKPRDDGPLAAAPAPPVAVAALHKAEGGTPVGTPGAVRKKTPGGATAPAAGGESA
jgi:hypothetical protein